MNAFQSEPVLDNWPPLSSIFNLVCGGKLVSHGFPSERLVCLSISIFAKSIAPVKVPENIFVSGLSPFTEVGG